MLRTATFILLSSLLGIAVSDQASEVYNKDDSAFLVNSVPKFRGAADFSPSVQPYYVPIEGLGPNQHGYKLVNPQAMSQQTPKELTETQKDEVRKQEEFLRSVLEINKARTHQPSSSDGVRASNAHLSVADSRFRTVDLTNPGIPEQVLASPNARESAPHKIFNFRLNQQDQIVSSPPEPVFLHPAHATSPKPFQPDNDFNNFHSNPGDYSSNSDSPQQPETRKPSFLFREKSTTPAYQPDFGGVGPSGERTPFTRIPPKPNQSRKSNGRNDNQKGQLGFPTPTSALNVNSAFSPISTSEDPIRLSNSGEKFGERTNLGLVSQHQAPIIPTPFKFNFKGQGNDDEETQFISQVNENTAASVSKNAGASQLAGFQQEIPRTGNIETLIPPRIAPATTNSRDSPQDYSENKRTKIRGQRLRVPEQNKVFQDEYVDQGLPTRPPIPTNRFNNAQRFQESGLGETTEQTIDQELEARKQAEDAQYSFASSISDTVNDNSQSRQEVRDGLKLTGMYSYSDGYFKRTVYYEADEGGYRIVKEENEPIGTGPQYDPNGEVNVNYQQDGSNLQYKIRGDQLTNQRQKQGKTRVSAPLVSLDYEDQLELPN